ncbi:MAG: hypothetical protein GX051_05015 [Clostridiales bacterium]|nr:hypothetical protein [Clostridiales bacterium]
MQHEFDVYKRPLKHTRVEPVSLVGIDEEPDAFQGYAVKRLEDISFPLVLGKDELVIDFGDHYTGYLHLELEGGSDGHIADSPTNICFSFAEMPLELMETIEDDSKTLSVGWLQNDFKTIPFMPYSGSLERRWSFRYLKLRRVDSVRFLIKITSLYIDAVSAVRLEDCLPVSIRDPLLESIDRICVKTLKECEQDVFEDGPKRDRRLWIGDLRLQALVDYGTFRNIELVKRCIYLFARRLNKAGLVAPCVFPDTKPYVDEWIFLDYSLCLGLCLGDYLENTGDDDLPRELYEVAAAQVTYADSVFNTEKGCFDARFFIDHGNYDRSTAALGYVSYALRHMAVLAEKLGEPVDLIYQLLNKTDAALLNRRDAGTGLFAAQDGEISWQSQVWAALSGALTPGEARALLERTEEYNPDIHMSSPFMTHYYLEALYSCGNGEKAVSYMKAYWGDILKAGFDCCPECFDSSNERLSPYSAPVLNSACHAWSCTPSYWIRKYHTK